MGGYGRLQDNQMHADHVEKNSPKGLRDRASCDPAVQAEDQGKAEEAEYGHVGGGSGRLGAAVQRAMAMRERQSTETGDVKGIGAMRHLYNIHNTFSAPAEFWGIEATESNIVLSPPPEVRSQSMRYSRFYCPASIADEDQHSSLNKAPDLGNNITCRSLPQCHQIYEAFNSYPLPQRSTNAPAKKKGFFRKLFRLPKRTA